MALKSAALREAQQQVEQFEGAISRLESERATLLSPVKPDRASFLDGLAAEAEAEAAAAAVAAAEAGNRSGASLTDGDFGRSFSLEDELATAGHSLEVHTYIWTPAVGSLSNLLRALRYVDRDLLAGGGASGRT